jgi:hypothetical protein
MKKHKFLVLMCSVLAVAVFALSSGDALAEKKDNKDAKKQAVTLDDQAKKFGKKAPSEQKAAAKRNRDLGLLPGVAGKTAQTPASGAAR